MNPIIYQVGICAVCLFFFMGGKHPPMLAQSNEQVRTDTQQTDAIVGQQKASDFQETQILKLFARQNALEADEIQLKNSDQSTQKTFAGVVAALSALATVFQARLTKKVNTVVRSRRPRRRKRRPTDDDEYEEDDEEDD